MKTPVLIYDGECPLCRGAASWIESHARAGAIELLTCQSPDRPVRFPGVSREQCMESIQFILPSGAVLSGADALPEILERTRGWRWLARFLRLPGITFISPHVYAFIAHNRYKLSAVAHKKDPDTSGACGIKDGRCD